MRRQTNRFNSPPQLSQCAVCKWHIWDDTCQVFPKEIPRDILGNMADHRLPYPGDGGVLFEAQNEKAAKVMLEIMGREPGVLAAERRELEKHYANPVQYTPEEEEAMLELLISLANETEDGMNEGGE